MEWILTWLWQGTLVAGATVGLLRAASRINAATRHRILWVALIVVLLLPAAFSSSNGGVVIPLREANASAPAVRAGLEPPAASGRAPLALPAPPAWVTWGLGSLWVIWVGAHGRGFIRSLQQIRAIARRCRPMPQAIERRLRLWQTVRNQGRRVSLAVSDEVVVACLVGLGRPTIAIPSSLVAGLDADELDQVVLHEYAHVQRWDDWSNLWQVCVDSICGWHPGVWLLGRALRLEREVASDDWVLARQTSARAYASCLTTVATIISTTAPPPLAPGVARSRGELTRRVTRLLDRGRNAAVRPSSCASLVAALILSTTVVIFGRLAPLATFEPVPLLRPTLRSTTTAPGPSSFLPAVSAPEDPWPVSHVTLAVDLPVPSSPPHRGDGPVPLLAASAPAMVPASRPEASIIPTGLPDAPRGRMRLPQADETGPLAATALIPAPTPLQPDVSAGGDANVSGVRPDPTREQRSWSLFADTGRAIGATASATGRATAGAFSRVGAGLSRAFRDGR